MMKINNVMLIVAAYFKCLNLTENAFLNVLKLSLTT